MLCVSLPSCVCGRGVIDCQLDQLKNKMNRAHSLLCPPCRVRRRRVEKQQQGAEAINQDRIHKDLLLHHVGKRDGKKKCIQVKTTKNIVALY